VITTVERAVPAEEIADAIARARSRCLRAVVADTTEITCPRCGASLLFRSDYWFPGAAARQVDLFGLAHGTLADS
jgi:hypothetical protein